MLETNDVDDDYFTPISSTSLSNIFGNSSHTVEDTENPSLKYIPPKPQNITQKSEENKSTQCIFACVLFCYEWSKHSYTTKGKLGFAILQVVKTDQHNIVLYDSNKTTLSCVTISSALEIVVKADVYISYYDNFRKYWSLYGTANEIKNIIDLLKSLNATIINSPYSDNGPPKPSKTENLVIGTTINQLQKTEKESDTDSSVDRKTKTSILSRMANMGQSVLPPHTIATEKTSDSSDANESNHYPKTRHKTIKTIVKRNNQEKYIPEVRDNIQSLIKNQQRPLISKSDPTIDNIPLYTYVNGQLVPVTNTNVITTSSDNNDMNLFMSEQRISNSEVRINVSRINDKVDQLLDKVKDLGHNSSSTTFQNEILQKLLTEYENKIKSYEEINKVKDIENTYKQCTINESRQYSESIAKEFQSYKEKISQLQELNKLKDTEIHKLQNELEQIHNKKALDMHTTSRDILLTEIQNLKDELIVKNEQLDELSKKYEYTTLIENKVKSIMNDTFYAISNNFENNETYSGEAIKGVIGKVIKKVTIDSLNEIK